MVDEQFSNIESSQRHNLLSSSTCTDIEMDFNEHGITSNDFNSKLENGINSISYDASTSSPESTSENAFNFNGCKYNSTSEDKNGEKKVHWNPNQVHALLDCIEKRMCDFRRKSVHKSVWLSIGKEMSEHGEFSVEHCYNKWKNLRRDIRLFSNTNSMQKLSIRNTYIMERVQKMVNEIGYEGSSRKSSSPISPNFDLVQNNADTGIINNSQLTNKEFWNAYSNLDAESRSKLENNNLCSYQQQQQQQSKPELSMNHMIKAEKTSQQKLSLVHSNHHDPNGNISNISHFHRAPLISNGDTVGSAAAIEDSIISLLSDPAVSQAILMNPKLLDEILPGLDFSALMKKFAEAHPELVHMPPVAVANSAPPPPPPPPAAPVSHPSLSHMVTTNHQFPLANGNVAIGLSLANGNNNNNHKKPLAAPPVVATVANVNGSQQHQQQQHLFHHHHQQQHQQQHSNNIHNNNNNNSDMMNNSWPHQLYELLHSFRDEESRQMARLDQIVGYVQVMQESTKRRLSTINQLISLAGMLIPQK